MDRNFGNRKKRSDAIGSRHRRWLRSVVLFATMGLISLPAVLLAVHDVLNGFELDGDATTGLFTVPALNTGVDDWDKVCKEITKNESTPLCVTAGSLPSTVKAIAWATDNLLGDGPSTNATLFTGGGSKDPLNTNQWAWKDGAGGLPDKDNLLHAFAIRYNFPATNPASPPAQPCENGTGVGADLNGDGDITDPGEPVGNWISTIPCDVLYFGSDRYDNSGDAQQGFWFFKKAVGVSFGADTNNDGTPDTPCPQTVGGGTGFCDSQGLPAVHTPGDVLVISDFSNGGGTSTITIYKWDPTCLKEDVSKGGSCGDANLRVVPPQLTGAKANCATAGSDDPACGLVNPSTVTMPWPFLDKSGTTSDQALNGEFFEAGINLSLLHLAGQCFSSVLSETRSSTSTTATLKDFVVSSFGNCAGALTTQATGASLASPVSPGTPVTDRATITITGATSPADATGTVSFAYCYSANPAVVPDCTSASITKTSFGSAVNLTNADCSPVVNDTSDGISCALSATVNDSGQTGARGTLAPGNYCFVATATLTNYASPGAHTNQTNECFTVTTLQPTMKSNQTWTLTDEATIEVGTAAGNLAGSLVFKLYLGTDCTGTLLYQSNSISVSNATSVTKSPAAGAGATGSYPVEFTSTPSSTPPQVSWLVTYTSTNLGHNNVVERCAVQNSTLTITGDGTVVSTSTP